MRIWREKNYKPPIMTSYVNQLLRRSFDKNPATISHPRFSSVSVNPFETFQWLFAGAREWTSGIRHGCRNWEPLASHLCIKLRCIPIINPADNDDMFILFICILGEELFVAAHRSQSDCPTAWLCCPQWRSNAPYQLHHSTEIYVSSAVRCITVILT